MLDEPEHGVVLEAALARRQPEHRLVSVRRFLHRQRGQGDQRQGEVDREDGGRDPGDRARDVTRRVARLLGEGRDGLDARVRDHRNRDREQEMPPRRSDSPVQVRREDDVRMEDEREADHHEQQLRGEVDDGEEDVQARGLADPDDVQHHEQRDDAHSADDVPRVLAQRAPEDREVVRHEERRDGDRDDVVQHLRPRCPEGHELVERVAREARGAACLRVAHRSFRVRRSGGGEDETADDEDERCQPERDSGDEAERVVDRRAHVSVRRREERRRPEHAFEPLRPSAPASSLRSRSRSDAHPRRSLRQGSDPGGVGPQQFPSRESKRGGG